MAFFILATMSKKSRMPDLGRLTTCLAMKRDWSILEGVAKVRATSSGIVKCGKNKGVGIVADELDIQR